MPSSITLCYTPTHASNRFRLTIYDMYGQKMPADFLSRVVDKVAAAMTVTVRLFSR